MTTVIEEFVGKLGWQVDKKGPEQFKSQSKAIAGGLAKIGAAYTVVAGLITGVVTKINNQVAANYRLARSMGVTYEWLDTWADATKSAKIGTEGISTAVGYLQKQLGNIKLGRATLGIDEALKSIGQTADSLGAMSTGDQFRAVVTGLDRVADRSEQTAVASMLLGRSGGTAFVRFAALAKESGLTIDQYLARFDNLEFETNATAEASFRYAEALESLGVAADNIKAVLASYVGEALTPMLEGAREWIANNRELIKSKLVDWAKGAVTWLKDLWNLVSKIGGALGPLISAFGGLGNVLKLSAIGYLAVKFAAATKGVGNLTIAFKALTAAQMKAKIAEFFTGPAGVAGLAAIAMYSIYDLSKSLDDISNNSWGNTIARTLLRTKDKIHVWIAETFFGKDFKNNAERANYIAMIDQAQIRSFEKLKTHMKTIAEWINKKARQIGKEFFSAIFNPLSSGGVITDDLLRKAKQGPADPKAAVKSRYLGGVPAPVKQSSNYFNGSVTAPITINAAPGMSTEAIAGAVNKHIEKQMGSAVRGVKAQGVER